MDVVLIVVAVLLAAAAGFWAGRRSRPAQPAAAAPEPDLLLVQGLMNSHDLAGDDDDAQREHIERVLERVGVHALRPSTGSPVVEDRFEVVATVATPTPQLAGAVAGVVRPGWLDGTVLLRRAEVTVFAPAGPPA